MTVAYHGHTIQLRPRSLARRWARPARPAGPPLRAGEHPLLRESARHDDAQYVATEKAVYYRANREQAWQRIAWVDIARVEQSRATGALTLHGWPGGHGDPTRLMVGARSRLPAFTQERIPRASCSSAASTDRPRQPGLGSGSDIDSVDRPCAP
jgi:hypothetical protein